MYQQKVSLNLNIFCKGIEYNGQILFVIYFIYC